MPETAIALTRLILREMPSLSSKDKSPKVEVALGEKVEVLAKHVETTASGNTRVWYEVKAANGTGFARDTNFAASPPSPPGDDQINPIFRRNAVIVSLAESCWHTAAAYGSNSTFLLALAWLASGAEWKDATAFAKDTDGYVGLFRYDEEAWAHDKAISGDAAGADAKSDRVVKQVDLIARASAKAWTDLGVAGAGNVSSVLLFLAMTVGASAAWKLAQTQDSSKPDLDQAGADRLAKAAQRYRRPFDATQTAGELRKSISDAFDEAYQRIGAEIAAFRPADALETAADELKKNGGDLKGGIERRLVLGANEVYRKFIQLASHRTGIDPIVLAVIVNAEALPKSSGVWDPDSKAAGAGNTALGLTQFIAKTWLGEAVRKGTSVHARAVAAGMVAAGAVLQGREAALLELRRDPELSILAAADYAKHNLDQLQALGVPIAGKSLQDMARLIYLAHHEGAAGARNFLKGAVDDPAGKLKANIQDASRIAALVAKHGSENAAYIAWLNDYMDRKIDIDQFSDLEADEMGGSLAGGGGAVTVPVGGSTEEKMRNFLAANGIVSFSAQEVLYLGGSHHGGGPTTKGKNAPPPENLWRNIIPTLKALEKFSARIGRPIAILSAYRNEAYNKAVGGKPGSLHKQFNAIDFVVIGANTRPSQWAAELKKMREQKDFEGGIGTYAKFVHIDTRGTNATW